MNALTAYAVSIYVTHDTHKRKFGSYRQKKNGRIAQNKLRTDEILQRCFSKPFWSHKTMYRTLGISLKRTQFGRPVRLNHVLSLLLRAPLRSEWS